MADDAAIIQDIFGLVNLKSRKVRQLFSTFDKAFTITHDRDKYDSLFHIYSDPALTNNDNCYLLIPKEDTLAGGSDTGVDPSNSQWQEINTFFNTLSTIDLSLSIPFIEVRWFESFRNNDEATDISEKNEPKAITVAEEDDPFNPNKEVTDPDLYFLPQTYYNAAKNKFRPFLAVKSFDVDLTNPADIFAQYSGVLVLKLYDITRLNEVRKFIYPGQSHAATLLIEYGWQHPHGNKTLASRFINSLRSAMYWQVNMYDVTIQQDNTADITLQLNTITPFKLARASLISDDDLPSLRNQNIATQKAIIEKITNEDKKKKPKKAAKNKKTSRVTGCYANKRNVDKISQNDARYDLTSSGKNGSKQKLRKALSEELKKFFLRVFLSKPTQGQKQAAAILNTLSEFTDAGSGKFIPNDNHAVNKFRKFIEFELRKAEANEQVSSLNIGNFRLEDPKRNDDSYTYLALLLMRLYGKSVATAELTSEPHIETQIVFLNFNRKAADMAGKNIGSFLVYLTRKQDTKRKTGFLDFVKQKILEERHYNPRLSDVMVYIKNILSNPENDNYGFDISKLTSESITLPGNRPAQKFTTKGKKWTKGDREFILPEVVIKSVELQANTENNSGIKIVRRIFVMDLAEQIPKNELQKAIDKLDRKCSATAEDIQELITEFRHELPIISVGTERNMVKTLSVKTMSDASFQSVFLAETDTIETASNTEGKSSFPGEFLPVMVDMETYGFPNLQFGVQVFLDLHTNTTVDDVYRVIGMKHKFQPGSITTSIQLYPGTGWIRYRSVKGVIDELDKLQENKNE